MDGGVLVWSFTEPTTIALDKEVSDTDKRTSLLHFGKSYDNKKKYFFFCPIEFREIAEDAFFSISSKLILSTS
jgi:hypothetical protein